MTDDEDKRGKRAGRMNESMGEGPRSIALLDTRSLVEHAPKQNAPPAERQRLSSEKKREFRLRSMYKIQARYLRTARLRLVPLTTKT